LGRGIPCREPAARAIPPRRNPASSAPDAGGRGPTRRPFPPTAALLEGGGQCAHMRAHACHIRAPLRTPSGDRGGVLRPVRRFCTTTASRIREEFRRADGCFALEHAWATRTRCTANCMKLLIGLTRAQCARAGSRHAPGAGFSGRSSPQSRGTAGGSAGRSDSAEPGRCAGASPTARAAPAQLAAAARRPAEARARASGMVRVVPAAGIAATSNDNSTRVRGLRGGDSERLRHGGRRLPLPRRRRARRR